MGRNRSPDFAGWRLELAYPRLLMVHSARRGEADGQPMSIVTLGVTDLKRSREFYERLGWRKSMAKAKGIVSFQTAGMALALCPRHELAKDANVQAFRGGYSGYFSDPDGFLREVAWNPCFAIAEDGSIQLPHYPTDRGAQRTRPIHASTWICSYPRKKASAV